MPPDVPETLQTQFQRLNRLHFNQTLLFKVCRVSLAEELQINGIYYRDKANFVFEFTRIYCLLLNKLKILSVLVNVYKKTSRVPRLCPGFSEGAMRLSPYYTINNKLHQILFSQYTFLFIGFRLKGLVTSFI